MICDHMRHWADSLVDGRASPKVLLNSPRGGIITVLGVNGYSFFQKDEKAVKMAGEGPAARDFWKRTGLVLPPLSLIASFLCVAF